MYRYSITYMISRHKDLQLNNIYMSIITYYTVCITNIFIISSGGHPMTRYSLEEVFGSQTKNLSSFKSRKVTKTGFYCYGNSLAVLEDEETVIGVLGGGSG